MRRFVMDTERINKEFHINTKYEEKSLDNKKFWVWS